ncbi:MAG TPA: hypothetical protein VI670_10355 [Thermoanaerobaculia bacterium]|jgi:hypothetical protein
MTRFVSWVRSLWPFGGRMIFPERRRSRRYLTLRNAARAAIMLVVAFILLSLWAAFRPAHSGTSLWEEGAASSTSTPAPREPFPVVREGSAGDYPPAGPIQILNESPAVPPAPPPIPQRQTTIEPREPQPRLGNGQRIVISGGSEGVQVHVETATTAPAGTPP